MLATDHRDPNAFRDWLLAQLDERQWSQARLARELDVFKGTVGRWLMPADNPAHRRPKYESCRRLAALLGVDPEFVLRLAGLEGDTGEQALTALQRDVIALVPQLPDDILATIYPQLRALIDPHVQRQIRERVAAALENGGA
jgi:transcriptional regulator with XRE-family HTH domain